MNQLGMTSNPRPVLFVSAENCENHSDQVSFLKGWSVNAVDGIQNARRTIKENKYNVGLIHLEQSDGNGISDAEALIHENSAIEWVLLTNNECLKQQKFCKLIREGCYDFYTLPFNSTAESSLQSTLGHAYGMASLNSENTIESYDDYEMVGTSQQMLSLFASIRKVASVDASVLITGESGTGKELIARAIHERSARKNEPFIAVNCGAIPENLIQSELFGHEKGAFTGAHQLKIGQIEAADGGTLLLDEIGDLPLTLQVNLLRFLQEQAIQRVGATSEIGVNVRVLAATHVDLDLAVSEGRFREDLLYRLNVLQVQSPALREREQDIELLARFFFNRFKPEGNNRLKGFSNSALIAIEQYQWPGNVRELINRIRRAIVMSEGRMISTTDLGLGNSGPPDSGAVISLDQARQDAEQNAIISALRYCRNNMTKSAKVLGVSRVTLYRMIEKYQLGKIPDDR